MMNVLSSPLSTVLSFFYLRLVLLLNGRLLTPLLPYKVALPSPCTWPPESQLSSFHASSFTICMAPSSNFPELEVSHPTIQPSSSKLITPRPAPTSAINKRPVPTARYLRREAIISVISDSLFSCIDDYGGCKSVGLYIDEEEVERPERAKVLLQENVKNTK